MTESAQPEEARVIQGLAPDAPQPAPPSESPRDKAAAERVPPDGDCNLFIAKARACPRLDRRPNCALRAFGGRGPGRDRPPPVPPPAQPWSAARGRGLARGRSRWPRSALHAAARSRGAARTVDHAQDTVARLPCTRSGCLPMSMRTFSPRFSLSRPLTRSSPARPSALLRSNAALSGLARLPPARTRACERPCGGAVGQASLSARLPLLLSLSPTLPSRGATCTTVSRPRSPVVLRHSTHRLHDVGP